MNLFDIDECYYSHPGYPFRKHISNMAASFDNSDHKTAAEFHDFGKLCEEFQDYIKTEKGGKVKTTHALESALYFLLRNDLMFDKNSFAIFFTILKHHGDLPDVDEYILNTFDDDDKLTKAYYRIKEICRKTGLQFDLKKDINELIELFDEDEFTGCMDLKGIDSYFNLKDVFSKLIFADKYEAIFKNRYAEIPIINSKRQIEKLIQFLSSKQNSMASVRNQARQEIIDNYKVNSRKRMFIIEAPTGIGKTFTALHLALEIARDKQKNKIINALPMTSIIDQTFEEYGRIIDKNTLMKFHYLTNAKSYNEYTQETEQAETESTILNKQRNDYIASSWSGDTFIVTTFNQLLYSFFSNKNRDLIKFWTLRDSVIIIDEIQAFPRILLKDIAYVITWLSYNFNIDFILMSATIPAIKNFLSSEDFAELLDNNYYEMDFNNRYAIRLEERINSIELLVNEIARASKTNLSILCVVNTKRLAFDLFENLYKSDLFNENELYLLSTNHIPLHRKMIINDLKSRLGERKRTILISTQVIEAGVDLDFDIGFREFAPLSSIIQTAGRVNREGGKHNSILVVTDKIGKTPYDEKDILYEEVKTLLKQNVELRENKMLPFLHEYFQLTIKKTSKDFQLIKDIKNLNFESVFKIFNAHFMKEMPTQVPLFIEIKDELHNDLSMERDKLLNKLRAAKKIEEKMNIKILLKEQQKKVSKFVINVNENEVKNEFPPFYKGSEMRWCPYSFVNNEIDNCKNVKYSFKTGWKNSTDACCFF